MQQIERAASVARGQANLGEAEEVGGDERVLFDLAGKDQLENLARGLLVSRFKQAARRIAEDLGPGRLLRLGAIRGKFCIQSAELRGDLQVERDERCRLRVASFFT